VGDRKLVTQKNGKPTKNQLSENQTGGPEEKRRKNGDFQRSNPAVTQGSPRGKELNKNHEKQKTKPKKKKKHIEKSTQGRNNNLGLKKRHKKKQGRKTKLQKKQTDGGGKNPQGQEKTEATLWDGSKRKTI